VADDLNDPYHYQPETSWRRALSEFGGSNASWITKLAENTRSSPLGQAESVAFAPLTLAFTRAYAGPDWPAPADVLDSELAAEQATPDRLTASGFNPEYLQQAGGFLTRLKLNAGAGRGALALLGAERPALQLETTPGPQGGLSLTGSAAPPNPAQALTLEQQLAAAQQQTLGDYHNVHGERFAFNVDGSVVTGQNLMDAFVNQAEQATTAWLPRAPAASSSVTVTVDGKPVPNPFQLQLAPGQSIHVVATDGAGGQTGRSLAVPSTPTTVGSPGSSPSALPLTSRGSLFGVLWLLALALAAPVAVWVSLVLGSEGGASLSGSVRVGDS